MVILPEDRGRLIMATQERLLLCTFPLAMPRTGSPCFAVQYFFRTFKFFEVLPALSDILLCSSSFLIHEFLLFFDQPQLLHHQECSILLGKFSRMRNNEISKTATAGPGADSVLIDHHVRSRARSQRPARLQAALKLLLSGSTGKEDLKADRRVRHYKEVGLQEWPLAGRATVPCVLYTVSVSACLFVGERFFPKVYGRPLPSSSPFTLFARH